MLGRARTSRPKLYTLFSPTLSIILAVLLACVRAATADAPPPKRHVTTFSFTSLALAQAPDASGSPLVQVRLLDMNPAHVGTFLLDTGTGFAGITASMAAKLKLTPQLDVGTDRLPARTGQPQYKVFLPSFQVGQLPFAGEAIVLKDDELSKMVGQPVDGILGINVWNRCALLFDFPKHEITLWFPGDLTDDEVKGAGFTEAPLPLIGNAGGAFTMMVQAVNGPHHAQDYFVVDTGAGHTHFSSSFAKRLDLLALNTQPVEAHTFFGNIGVSVALVERLQLGPFAITNHLTDYPAQETSLNVSPNTLGMDKLSRFRVLMDFPARKIYLHPVAPLSGPTHADVPAPSAPAPQANPPPAQLAPPAAP